MPAGTDRLAAASPGRATGSWRARAGCSPGASTGSPRPGRCSTSARARGRCCARCGIAVGEAVGLEREASGPGVRAGDLRDVDERWAAIVLWHSLEHLRDPGDVAAHAAGLLAERGVLVIAMPNAASLQARAFGDRWFALDLPRHLVHVPAAALVGRLEALGLRVERVSHARGGQIAFGWLQGLVGLLPGRPDLYDALRRPEARRRPLSGRAEGGDDRRRRRALAGGGGGERGRDRRRARRHRLRRGAACLSAAGPRPRPPGPRMAAITLPTR